MIRSAIARARRSICAMTIPATYGVPPSSRSADNLCHICGATWLGAIANSSILHTASPVNSCKYVPVADPIKISRLTLLNTSRRIRRLSLTVYVEWALGPVLPQRVGAVRDDGDRCRHRW